MGKKGGFKNIKLGKDVHRQIKRRGVPQYPRASQSNRRILPAPPLRSPATVPADTAVEPQESNKSESRPEPG